MSWLRRLTARFHSANQPASARQVILYTRAGCHLCETAHAVLVKYGLQPQSIDVDSDPELQARFTNCVPVVVIDGREYFRGRVNEVLLRRLLLAPPTTTTTTSDSREP